MSLARRKLWFVLLLPLLAAVTVWQIRVDTDLNAFFTASDDADTRLLSGLLQSGELSRRYLVVVESSADKAALPGFVARLIRQWSQLDDVEQVWPAYEPPREWLDALRSYAPYHGRIFSLNPEEEGRQLFAPAGLAARAEALQQALLSPQAHWLKSIAKQDPLLLSLNGFKGLRRQFEQQAGSDGGALILQSRPAALDSNAQAALQAKLRADFEALNAEAGGGFTLAMAGVPVFSVAAQAEISRDVTLVSVASSLAVVLAFLALFRSFSALHWLMMLQAAAFLVGTLATALLFQRIHSLTLALGASLIGICVDYPLHVMVHAGKQRTALASTARLLWPSLSMGGLTTIVGYVALGFTGFPGFEQIAVFALFSIGAALLLTRWLLPALLAQSTLHSVHIPGIGAWAAFCRRRRPILLVVLALAALVAVFALPQLRWMDDMQKLALDMEGLKRQDAAVRAHFADIEPGRFVLVQAQDLETALQRAEAAERRLQQLQQAGIVTEYHGLFPWLVSAALQERNAEVYRKALTPAFSDAWRSALTAVQLSVDKLGKLSPPGPLLAPEQVLQTPVRHILAGQLLDGQEGVALTIWLGEHDPEGLSQALQGLAGVRYFSQKQQLDRLAGQYRDHSLWMLVVGIVVMALLIGLQRRSLTKALVALLPSLAAVLFIFAAWSLLGEELSFLHVIGLLLSISLCVDYGIFFIDNRGRDAGVTYQAIASAALTTLASFAALGLGKTPTLPILALSVSLGVVSGFLLCPLLIRSEADR